MIGEHILFHDPTNFEKVIYIVTDYVNLAHKLINLANSKGSSDKEINQVLNEEAKSIAQVVGNIDLPNTKKS